MASGLYQNDHIIPPIYYGSMPKFYVTILIGTLAILSACSSSQLDDVDIGQSLILTEGLPEFVVSVESSYTEQGAPFVRPTVEVSKGSLIFSSSQGQPTANITVTYEFRPVIEGDLGSPVINERFRYTITGDSDRSIQGYDRIRFSETFDPEPGTYSIKVMVTDEATGKTLERNITSDLPDVDDTTGNITSINMLRIEPDGSAYSIGTYDVQARSDSLTFRFFITRGQDDEPVYAHLRMLEFEADNEPARKMSLPNPSDGSIRVRGINYGRYEVLEQQSRFFENEFGAIEIEFNIPTPEQGSFRFEAFTTTSEQANQDNAIVYRARDFGMRPPNFPELASARELAEPLVYLMGSSEYEKLMEIEQEDELRRAVEQYWLENLGSADKAREVMNLFYQGVVEANKQFSNYKAGWKTDLGMVYILFGPPWYEDRFRSDVRWIYGFNENDPERVFFFDRTRIGNERYPFNNWTLQRRNFYHSVHYNRTQEWLSGFVLTRSYGG